MCPVIDKDLFFLVSTTGIQFLDRTYDVVPVQEGFALRVVQKSGALELFEPYYSEQALITGLKSELEAALYDHILGRTRNLDTRWTIK